jgi:hypothetical protein
MTVFAERPQVRNARCRRPTTAISSRATREKISMEVGDKRSEGYSGVLLANATRLCYKRVFTHQQLPLAKRGPGGAPQVASSVCDRGPPPLYGSSNPQINLTEPRVLNLGLWESCLGEFCFVVRVHPARLPLRGWQGAIGPHCIRSFRRAMPSSLGYVSSTQMWTIHVWRSPKGGSAGDYQEVRYRRFRGVNSGL